MRALTLCSSLLACWSLVAVALAQAPVSHAPVQGSVEQYPMRIAGEPLEPSAYGPGVIETMEAVIARDKAARAAAAGQEDVVDGPKRGVWSVPSPGVSDVPASGAHYVVNKYGATEMAIGFAGLTDVDGAFLVGQGSPAIAAQCLRVTGYRDGTRVGATGWLLLDTEPAYFDFGLTGVDRIVFEASPVLGGAAFFGMDDLTIRQGGHMVVLDFEDTKYKQVLTGSAYAGLTWETGSLGFRRPAQIVPAPQEGTLPQVKGQGNQTGGVTTRGGAGTPPTLGISFEGVRRGDAGSFSGPPDTIGAIGPNHFVETVNRNLAVYDRATGAELMNVLLTSFLPGSNGDPRVIYDQYAGRWVVINDDFNTTIYLAVSLTSDAMGAWFKTSINISQGSDTGCWPDYPTLGLDANGYYISAFMVNCGMSIFAIDKAPLIAGSPSLGTVTAFRGFGWEGAIQPVHTWGSAPGEYLVSTRSTTQLAVRRIDGPLTSPTLTDLGNVSVAAFSDPPDAPSRGASTPLDTVDSRLMNAVCRNGRIYAAHAIALGGKSGLRWYELDVAGMSVVQTGDVTDSSLYYMFPTITVNSAGDMALGFSGSDANTYGSAYFAGRIASDPAGQMSPVQLLRAGQASQSIIDSFGRNRFGDYSQTSLDPLDETTFWTVQEWVQATDIWSTWVGELQPASSIPCPGDVNGDNTVDVSDLGSLLANFGVSGAGIPGDLDGNGTVDVSDLGILLANFGLSCP